MLTTSSTSLSKVDWFVGKSIADEGEAHWVRESSEMAEM